MICVTDVLAVIEEKYAVKENISSLCAISCRETEKMVKDEKFLNDIRIINLAAAKTFLNYNHRESLNQENISSFKAGDVTVSFSPKSVSEYAVRDYNEALVTAAPLLKDNCFLFRRIKV